MSKKQHKGDHASRRERRDATRLAHQNTPTSIHKPRHIYLRNPLYILLTLLSVLASLGILLLLGFTGWWDSFLGSVLVIAVGAFGCMCLYDLGLLFTASIAFGEGMVGAGKNEEGVKMVFHAASVLRLEVRDKAGNVLPQGQKMYKNAFLAFVMDSGRVNLKPVSRLTDRQLSALREALERERGDKKQ